MSTMLKPFNPSFFKQAMAPCELLHGFLALCKKYDIAPYLVGGAVRDLLYTGILSSDLDFVVPADQAKRLSEELAQDLDAVHIVLDERFQIYRVILPQQNITLDIAGCIGPDIHTDLLRRDFTINAMAYDFKTETLLDPTEGQKDLANGMLKMLNEKNMLDDPLRLLRLFRVAAELGFTQLEPETLHAVCKHSARLLRVATERIHYEWMRLLSAPHCYLYVRKMVETGLLEHMFPEISAMHPIPKNRHHHLGLLDHTLELLNQLEIHLADLPPDIQTHLWEAWNPFTKKIAIVRLACLFHDVGKPPTMAYEAETDRYKFYGHELVSAQLVYDIGPRMKWGKDLTTQVAELCRWHLYPGNVVEPGVTEKAYRKFFRRVGHLLPDLIPLAIADRFSAQGPDISAEALAAKKQGLIALWDKFQAHQQTETTQSPRLLSGKEVMDYLNLSPGPEVGKAMKALEEAYLNGEISNKEEAFAWLQKVLS